MSRPKCTEPGVDPDLWFPDGLRGIDFTLQAAKAAQVCNSGCQLRASCLLTAMRHERGKSAKYRYGVFGGLTGAERAALEGHIVAAQQELAA